MKYSSNKDLNKYIRKLVSQDYVFKQGKRHGKLYSANGRFLLPVPCSPSDSNVLTIFCTDLKRIEVSNNYQSKDVSVCPGEKYQKGASL